MDKSTSDMFDRVIQEHHRERLIIKSFRKSVLYKEIVENEAFNRRVNKIYGLINPKTNKLFYIGCTLPPIATRLMSHLSCNGNAAKRNELLEIISNDMCPKIKIFYEIENRGLALTIEAHLINFVQLNTSINLHNSSCFPIVKDMGESKCATCHKPTPVKEIDENAKLGSYGFKPICDTCAEKIDAEMDSEIQDK